MPNDKKSENNEKSECMEVGTESEFQDEIEEGNKDFIASETRVKEESMSESDEEEFVRLDEHEAQTLINGPDYITHEDLETFGDNENVTGISNTITRKFVVKISYLKKQNFQNVNCVSKHSRS